MKLNWNWNTLLRTVTFQINLNTWNTEQGKCQHTNEYHFLLLFISFWCNYFFIERNGLIYHVLIRRLQFPVRLVLPSKALRSVKIFEVRWIFVKMDGQNRKNPTKNPGLFLFWHSWSTGVPFQKVPNVPKLFWYFKSFGIAKTFENNRHFHHFVWISSRSQDKPLFVFWPVVYMTANFR